MATAAKVIPIAAPAEAELSPTDLAREALAEANNLSNDAVAIMVKRVLEDETFFAQYREAMVGEWCRRRVEIVLKDNRRDAVNGVVRVDGQIFRDAAQANATRLMEMPIWGGKPIGEATADEIYESADLHDKTARTHTQQAEWQAAVAKALEKNGNPGDKCRDCLSETTLAALWEETANA